MASINEYALSKSHQEMLEKSLVETDPEIAEIMKLEIQRQRESIILIVSLLFLGAKLLILDSLRVVHS